MDDIGGSIRQLRLQKNMTLKDVAEKTNLSIGFLSQIERSKSSVTLQSLSKISDALNVSRSYFFNDRETEGENEGESIEINIPAAKRDYNFHNSTFVYQGLSGNVNNPAFEPMLVVLLPTSEKVTASTHNGQEFIYVLEGDLTVLIKSKETKVPAGGSFYINSSTPHTWYNETEEAVKLLYVYSRD